MANYSRPHICHCLTRIASVKRNAVVTVYGQRRRTGQEFVDGVLRLSGGLIRLGLRNGDVVSLAALNSDFFLEWLLAVALVGGIVAPLNYRWAEKDAEPLSDLLDEVDELKARESMYKPQMKKTCDLQKAEAEVDLLGDKIESLLDILEKIYIALDLFSPSLKH